MSESEPSNKGIKLVILTPSCRDPKWGYKNSLEMVMSYLQAARSDDPRMWLGGKRIAGYEVHGRTKTSLLPQGRQKLYDQAIKDGFDYALWWDDDVEIGIQALSSMLGANKPSVAANILCKGIPEYPELYPDDGIWFSAIGRDRKPMSSLCATGVEECYSCGMAFHLIHLPSISHIPRPHFEVRWDEDWNDYRGEDWFFTRKLADAGIPTLIDHDASRYCAHIGDWHYNIQNMATFMKSGKAFAKIAELMKEGKI